MSAITERLSAALAGRYRIERHLGEGGMATVFLAEDLKHKRKVALKVLKPELAAVLRAERIVQEITTTASLQHPHILALFDSGTADGFLFYVMPWIDGETLREKLSRETQLGVDEAVRIAREVLDALEYAHQHGIVHRDIKPENILLHGGHALVADFGIALAVSAAAGGRMTETGLSLGTPHYMSPEQATAEKEITARSDVYSVGSVLFEMLSGQPPHLGGSAQQIIMKIIAEPVEAVTKFRKSVPPNVTSAVAKSLEKLPADRFDSAKAFSEALGNPNYTNATAAGAAPTPTIARRRRLRESAAWLVAVVAVATTLWGWFRPTASVVSRERIVLWDDQQIPAAHVGREVAISPDAGTVVFMDSSGAGTQLYAKERERLDATAVAGTAGVAGAPAFSPDGAWIAFVTRDGKVKKVPRLGGSAIPIADSAYTLFPSLAWLDGGTILYVDALSGVRAVGQEGGATRKMFTPATDTAARWIRSVTGLPGGQAALLGACVPGCPASDLRVLDVKSLKITVLADQVLAGWPLPGGAVAFVRRDGGVLAAPFDLRTLKFTRPPTPMLDGVRTSLQTADMAVSANGTVIYAAGDAAAMADAQVVWVTRAGAVTPMDSAWTIHLGGAGGKLALSADSRRLAVAVARPGDEARHDIWIKQLDIAPFPSSKLTFDGDNISPAWTPDGQAVLYASGAIPPGLIRRRRADGTGPVDTLLTLRRGIFAVVLTHDTTQFVVRLAVSPSRDIVRGRRGDTASMPLMASPSFDEVSPALSPDGRWLAYASNESGRFEVYVRPYPDVNSGGRWPVSQNGGHAPAWAHSGRELFFRNGANALVAAAVVTGATFAPGAQTALFDVSRFAGTEVEADYDVAPDDRRFVFVRPVGRLAGRLDRLVQITNWAAEVRAKLSAQAGKK